MAAKEQDEKSTTPPPLDDEIPTVTIDVTVYDNNGKKATETIEFKSLRYIPLGVIRTNRYSLDAQLYAVMEWAVAEKYMPIVDLVPSSQLLNLYQEMQNASEVDMGESDGSSSTSSKTTSTGQRSKRTSSTEDSD